MAFGKSKRPVGEWSKERLVAFGKGEAARGRGGVLTSTSGVCGLEAGQGGAAVGPPGDAVLSDYG